MKGTMQMSKKRRVDYCVVVDDSTARFTTFCVKYLTYLLQALRQSTTGIKLSGGDDEEHDLDMRKRVRLEIDMAMVASVGTHLKWTKTLKQKLDACRWRVPVMADAVERPERHPLCVFLERQSVPSAANCRSLSRSVEIRGWEMKKRIGKQRKSEVEAEEGEEEEEVGRCMEMLREVVPIGDEACSAEELMGEVLSYVACLQFQVGALRCLLSNANE